MLAFIILQIQEGQFEHYVTFVNTVSHSLVRCSILLDVEATP